MLAMQGCSLLPLIETLVSQFGHGYPLVSIAQTLRSPLNRSSNLPTSDYRSERGSPPPRPPPPSAYGPPRPPLPPQLAGRPHYPEAVQTGQETGGLGRSDSVGSESDVVPPPPPRPPMPSVLGSTLASHANGYVSHPPLRFLFDELTGCESNSSQLSRRVTSLNHLRFILRTLPIANRRTEFPRLDFHPHLFILGRSRL